MRHIHLDVETYCDLELAEVGVRNYVSHPSFQLLAAANSLPQGGILWKADAAPGVVEEYLRRTLVAIPAGPLTLHAWNVAFELEVIRRMMPEFLRRPGLVLSCTMQRALAYGLPGSLEHAATALGTAPKDAAGRKLMLQLCRPHRKTGTPYWMVPEHQAQMPAKLLQLGGYCGDDVQAEMAIAGRIPELSPEEVVLAGIDREMNLKGVRVDRSLVTAMAAKAAQLTMEAEAEIASLTGGIVEKFSQGARLVKWVNDQMPPVMPAMRGWSKDEVDRVLGLPSLSLTTRKVLSIRQDMAKSSVAKLSKIRAQIDLRDRACWQFQFLGAGRTGRWSGRGIQLQNLPRPPGKDFDVRAAINWVFNGASLPEALRLLSPMALLSGALRACFVAESGNFLLMFDFSQIEARLLAWLAGQLDILEVFAAGQDVYVHAAASVGSTDRQLGKVMVLALGFGMGAEKFMETAATYGLTLSPEVAEEMKQRWRKANRRIVSFWYDLERAVRAAIETPGSLHEVGMIRVQKTARTLQLRLPSGRILYYHGAHIDPVEGDICFWGVVPGHGGESWGLQKTYGGKLAENVTQAVARDVMACAMVRVAGTYGRVPVMSVHDELVYEVDNLLRPRVLQLTQCMREVPPWAQGLPLAGDSKVATRYGK